MNIEQFTREDDRFVRTYDYDDRSVLAADLGVSEGSAVDVVDGTVIVVLGDGDTQFELDLPADAGDARAFIKNGVLTVEMEA